MLMMGKYTTLIKYLYNYIRLNSISLTLESNYSYRNPLHIRNFKEREGNF
jgi:hypothetical protein